MNALEAILAYILSMDDEKSAGPESKSDDSDAWTLGSGDVVETEKVEISVEEVNKSTEANVKAAGDARKQYADTVKKIVADPENWSGNLGAKILTSLRISFSVVKVSGSSISFFTSSSSLSSLFISPFFSVNLLSPFS